DYLGVNGTITFAAGETSKIITVPVVNDDVYENPESMYVNLSNAVNAEIADSQGEGRINDESDKPSISVSNPETVEGEYEVFHIQLSNPSTEDVIFELSTTEGSATQDDYAPETEVSYDGGVTWVEATEGRVPAGETEILARVKTTQDDTDEPVEEFTLTVDVTSDNTTNVSSTGTASIIDNDGIPQIVISDSSVNEEDGVLTFTISLSNPSSETITVDYVTADGTALAGSDYVSDSNTVTFLAGETSKTISISVLDDSIYENPESMYVNLSNVVNAEIADSQGEGRIYDSGNNDDIPTLSISDSVVTEGDYNIFTVQISNPSTEDIKFDFSTTDGTATANEDYRPDLMESYEVSSDGGITWSPATSGIIKAGDTAILVRIPTVEDNISESTENYTFTATVTEGTTTNNTYPTGLNATGKATIIDDDGIPSIIIGDAVVNEEDGTITFKVSLTNPSDSEITVDYETVDGT
ncbi:Calx-beta domain-containing protein, partial [Malaciobacter pacificus]